MPLSLFPSHCPIGRIRLPDGTEAEVLMTPEFARAMGDLFERVGGDTAMSNGDLAVLESFGDTSSIIASMAAQIEALQAQMSIFLEAPAVNQYGPDLQIDYSFVQPPTDWEHPGKIGAQTPNTGSFTLLKLAAGTVLLPTIYFATDTTSGWYRPAANTIGLTISAVLVATWSSTGVLYKQNVTTEKQLVSTVAAGTPPLVVTSNTQVPNLYVARSALADQATALAAPTAFPANATDLPTAITLVNALKAAGVSKGL